MVYARCENNPLGVSTCVLVVDIDKRIKESSERTHIERRNMSLLKDVWIRK